LGGNVTILCTVFEKATLLRGQKSKSKILVDRGGQIYAIHKDCLRWETVLLGDRNLA
jgi:hypothetical protein